MYKTFIKRLLDIAASSVCLVVFSPVILVTAALVRLKLGSPVLFSQERPGKGGKVFTLRKFRTMTGKCGEDGKLLPDGERLTKFGEFLRSSSLDELPELLNILKGDMSLVGPRPLLVEYLPHYDEFQKRRHEVRPGLTGLAQVNGRNLTTWDERFKFDVEYVDSISFRRDMAIMLQTIVTVFKREGISSENSATMESFVDSKKQQRVGFLKGHVVIPDDFDHMGEADIMKMFEETE